jgi:TPR repeat protein
MTARRIAATCALGLALSASGALAEPLPGQRAAAEAGDVRAMYALGIIYDTGSGVEPDYTEGFMWFERSAKGGHAPAQAKMGLMYLYGWQIRRDVAEAARWYELAARRGDVRSQVQISSMYARGQGVEQDLVAAYTWLGVAARAGDAQAAYRLPRLARELSEADLARAEGLVKAWRPGR